MQLMHHFCISKTVVIPHLAPPVTVQCCCCHFAPTFSQRFFAENPKRAHRVWKHLSNFCPGSRSRERPDTVCGKRELIFSARKISHLQNLCATCGLGMSAEMAHVTLAAKRLDLTSAPVLICTGINSFSRILALEWRTRETNFARLTDMCRLPLALSQNPCYTSALELDLNTKAAGKGLSSASTTSKSHLAASSYGVENHSLAPI